MSKRDRFNKWFWQGDRPFVAYFLVVVVAIASWLAFLGKAEAATPTKAPKVHNYCVWRWGYHVDSWGPNWATWKWNGAPYVNMYLHSSWCPKGATPVYVEVNSTPHKHWNIAETYPLGSYYRIYLDRNYDHSSWNTKYSTMQHELGHVVGLNHTRDNTIMNPYKFYTYISPAQFRAAR